MLVLALMFLRFSFYTVYGHSMQPTLNPGDRVILKQHDKPAKEDIIVFSQPSLWKEYEKGDFNLIKRIKAVPGDLLEFKGGVMFVNGKEMFDTKKNNYECSKGKEGYSRELSAREVFVMGDNYKKSLDSMRIFCDGNPENIYVTGFNTKDIGQIYKKI